MTRREDRWWRPRTTRRPAQRARARRMYTGKELDKTFDIGYTVGKADEEKRWREYADRMLRLADASEAASNGDPGPMDELAREMGLRDDLMDVADASAATPLVEVDGEQLAAEFEQWLRGQDGE